MDFMPISTSNTELFGVPADGPQIVRLQTADETNLREVDDFGLLRGAVVQQLKRGPILRAQAEEIDAELDGGRGVGKGEGGRGGEPHKAASGNIHFARSIHHPKTRKISSASGELFGVHEVVADHVHDD